MKLFIDCGTHLFQGLKQFNEKFLFDNKWEIFSFEANPYVYSMSINEKPNFENLYHLNKAVSTENSFIEVNIDKNNIISQGTNILKNPPQVDGVVTFDWFKKIKVECIDLCDFINQRSFDYCVVKLDVEGAEFDILEKLISTDVISKIDELYVEFHERFFTNELEKFTEKRKILSEICTQKTKKFDVWF